MEQFESWAEGGPLLVVRQKHMTSVFVSCPLLFESYEVVVRSTFSVAVVRRARDGIQKVLPGCGNDR